LILACFAYGTENPGHSVWQELASFDFISARAHAPQATTAPAAQLATALALLGNPNRQTTEVERAGDILRALAAGSGNGETAFAAAYWEARRLQWYAASPDVLGAIERYRQLYAAHPESYYGQLALLKSIVPRLYLTSDQASIRREANEIALLLPSLTFPEIRRNAHLSLGDVLDRLNADPQLCFEQYRLAAAENFTSGPAGADVLARLVTQARDTGHFEEAIITAKRFSQEHAFDRRAFELSEIARSLKEKPP
jgi:hypothetical protein